MLAALHCATLGSTVYANWTAEGVVDGGSGRVARIATDIIRDHEADALVDVISHLTPDLKKLDSTDGLPAYETYVRNMGADLHPVASQLHPLMQRMTAFARDSHACPTCFLCTLLLRRYTRAERVRVHSHFDRNAIVTAAASLNGGQRPRAFEGGFFLQRTARSSSRAFVETNRTDAIFHGYDLNHGVDLIKGTRYSAVFWFSDSPKSCEGGTSPWYESSAADGSMDAQAALGELHQLGSSGYPRDATTAAAWFERAAAQGSAAAQTKLGRMLLAGEGVERDKERGMHWVRLAAEQGHGPAEYTMGVACQYGDVDGGLEAAASWFARAAEEGIAAAQYELGAAYINGDGVEEGQVVLGAFWLHRAAAQGHKDAVSDLEALAEDPAWAEVEAALAAWEAEQQQEATQEEEVPGELKDEV